MGKIVCEKCGTEFKFEVAKNFDCCPVCGVSFSESGEETETPKEKIKFYYYREGGGVLTSILSSHFTPLYTFDAVDLQDAERQLKKVMPSYSLLDENPPAKIQCPRCRSTEIQLVPRKYSLLTGFATNQYDRVCLRCQKQF